MSKPTFLEFYYDAPFRVKFKVASLALLSVVVFVAGIMSVYVILKANTNYETKEQERLAEEHHLQEMNREVAAWTYEYRLENLSIPLVNRSANKIVYAQFTLLLDCPTPQAKQAMVLNRAQIIDSVIEVASHLYAEDFEDNKVGLEHFKEALLKSHVEQFGKLAPRGLVFEDWYLN